MQFTIWLASNLIIADCHKCLSGNVDGANCSCLYQAVTVEPTMVHNSGYRLPTTPHIAKTGIYAWSQVWAYDADQSHGPICSRCCTVFAWRWWTNHQRSFCTRSKAVREQCRPHHTYLTSRSRNIFIAAKVKIRKINRIMLANVEGKVDIRKRRITGT